MTALRFTSLAALIASLAAPAATQPDRPQPRPAPLWQVDWGDQFCTLIRLPDQAIPYIVAVRALPGEEAATLRLMAGGHAEPPARVTEVVLAPSGRAFPVHSSVEMMAHNTRVIGAWWLPPEFWDLLAGSTGLQLKDGSRVTGRAPLNQSRDAVRALRRCVSDAMREWGIDEAAWRALSRRPKSTNALGIEDQDYPAGALARGEQGRVVVRIDVDANGRATACAPVASSHTPEMDAAACHAAMSRGRFAPALEAAGRPTAARTVTSVTFLAQ